jgi:hypothetical protein
VAHNDGHALPHIVEVQDAEQLVHLHLAQGLAIVSNGKDGRDGKYLKRSWTSALANFRKNYTAEFENI